MKVISVHGVGEANTNFACDFHTRVQRLIPDADVSYDNIVWSDATSGIVSKYSYLSEKRPFFWGLITKYVDPLAVQILHYMKNKKDVNNIISDFDRDFRRALGKERDVVVVAHSLGSVIAFDYLFGFADKKPPEGLRVSLVTIGSPLPIFWAGMEHFKVPKLPKHITRWTNIYSKRDPIGAPVMPYGADAWDVEVKTHFLPIRAHVGYWKNARVAEIVAEEASYAGGR